MHSLKFNFTRIAFAFVLLAVGFASAASAQPPGSTSTFRFFVDVDPAASPATGCPIPTTLGTPLTGIDQVVTVVVNTGPPPTIASSSRQVCSGGVFVAATPPAPPGAAMGPLPGPGNLSTIETSAPLASLPTAAGVRVYFDSIYSGSNSPQNRDELLTLDGTSLGGGIIVQLIVGDIPTLSEWGLILLALLLSVSAFVVMRRRGEGRRAAAGLLLVVFALGAGVAWAAITITVDGNPGDWTVSGITVATDSNSPPALANADIEKGYGVIQVDSSTNAVTLFLRIDVKFTGGPLTNNAPVVNPATFSIAENSANGTNVGTVTVTDPDAGQTHTFAITAGNTGGAFAINPTTGQITVANMAALNFETTPTFSLTVQATDNGTPNLSGTGTVTVNLTNVNEAPVVNNDAYAVAEGGTLNPAVPGVLGNDMDPEAGSLTATLVTGPLHSSAFTLNANGSFTYTHDGSATTTDSFTYRANDGTSDSNIATVTINIGAVNDAPVVDLNGATAGTDYAINYTEGDGTEFIEDPAAATITDDDSTTLVSLRVTLTNLLDSGFEVLDVDLTGADPAFSKNYDTTTTPGTGVLTITASPARPIAEFVTLLRKVTYVNTDENPVTTARSIEFVANDGIDNSNTAVTTVTMAAVNDAPVAQDDAFTTAEDTPLSGGNVLANNGSGVDSDADGDTLTVNTTPVSGPSNGTLTLNADGTFTYNPNLSFNGTDTFQYQVLDGNGGTDVGLVTITVTSMNDAPVAQDDAFTTAEDTPLSGGNVLANNGSGADSDADGDTLTVNTTPVSGPSNGTLTLNADGTFTYNPNLNFNGTDTFQYQVLDGNGGTDVGLVTITVTSANDAPVAQDDAFTTAEDTPLSGGNVLANNGSGVDSDADGDTLTVNTTPVSGPSNGTLTLNADGTFTYNPNLDFTGTDTFQYQVLDGNGGTDVGLVTITVTSMNDAPVVDLDADDSQGTSGTGFAVAYAENAGAVPIVDSADATITDIDNTTLVSLTVTLTNLLDAGEEVLAATSGSPGITVEPYDTTTVPGQGILRLTTTTPQPIADFVTALRTVTYTHSGDAPDTSAPRAITFVANDGTVAGPAATSTVTITSANDSPVAQDDAFTTAEDTPLSSGNVLANNGSGADSDPDGDTLTVNTTPVSGPSNGTLTLNADGTFTYTPNLNFTGTDTFQYEVSDGNGGTDVGQVTITVTSTNDAPVAQDDAFTTAEDTPLSSGNVLANNGSGTDSDPDGDTLTVNTTPVSGPTNGTLTLNADGTFTYTPNLNFTGTDTFQYQVLDGNSGTDIGLVTITVTAVNDAPVARDDAFTTAEDTPLSSSNVLANNGSGADSDADGDTLTVNTTPVSGPTNGTLTLNADGTFTYTPNLNFNGTDTFQYQVLDGNGGSDTGQVTITVTAVNDAPVARDDAFTTPEDTPLSSGNVLADNGSGADSDPEGDTLTVNTTPVSGPSNGTLTLNANGTFTYSPNLNFNGTDTFQYQISDGNGGTDIGQVTITVTAVNDAPVANPDAADITEEAPNVAAANTVSGNVLTNDTDPDGAPPSTVSAVAGGSVGSPRAGTYGSVTINSNGSYTYTLDDNNAMVNALAPGGMLTESFGYTASDGTLTSSSTLTVTIHGADDPATPDDDAYDFIGNTQILVQDNDAAGAPHVFVDGDNGVAPEDVLDGDIDPDGGPAISISGIVGCPADTIAPFDCVLPGQGTVSLQADGSFSFVPEAGDNDPTASFQYTLTGNPIPGTVTLTRFGRIWYQENNAASGGTGTSTSHFSDLSAAESASQPGDTIYVFVGNGNTTRQDDGITLKNGQRLLGEGVQLDLPVSVNGGPNPTVLRAAGTKPGIDNDNSPDAAGEDNGVSVPATAGAMLGVEIRGLDIRGLDNAVDITSTGTNRFTVTVADNTISSAGLEGVDVNQGGTNATTSELSFHDNTLTATGAAADIQRTAGSLTITAFHDNVVTGNSVGGILVTGVTNPIIFDATPGGGIQPVPGGTTVIGDPGNRIGGPGLTLSNVTGALNFANPLTGPIAAGDLDIFTDSGAALSVAGGAGGFDLDVTPNAGVLVANAGSAAVISGADLSMQLNSLTSNNSTGAGVSLTNVTGIFSAPGGVPGSSITNAGTTDFLISGGTANVTYGGTITDDVGQLVSISGSTGGTKSFTGAISDGPTANTGSGISLTGNGGTTISFSGGLALSTGANAAFTATGGGTLSVCDENPCNPGATGSLVNTLTTTTGTALNVASTTISANSLEFRSISANGASNGIILNATGNLGGLSVKGTGSAGSGGTIQNITNRGASFIDAINIALTNMNFTNANTTDGATSDGVVGGNENTDENGAIHLQNVTQVDLTGLSINGAVQHGINGNNVTDLDISNTTIQNTGDEVWESGIFIFDLRGLASAGRTSVFDNVNITNDSGQFNIALLNDDGTNDRPAEKDRLEVSNSQFTRNGSNALISDNVSILNSGTANFQVVVSGSTFASTVTCGSPGFNGACVSDNIQVDAGNTAAFDAVISSGNNFTNGNAGQSAVNISASGAGQGTFNVSNIVTTVRASQGINVALTTTNAAASLRGTIANNNLSTNVTNNAGSGIQMVLEGSGTMVVDVNNNTINGNGSTDFDYGIRGGARAGSGVAHFQANNNSVPSAEVAGVWFFSGNATAGETSQTCVNFVSNLIDGDPVDAFTDYFTEMYTGTTFQLQGLAGSGANATNVQNFIAGTDDDPSPTDPTVNANSGTTVNYTNAVCQTP